MENFVKIVAVSDEREDKNGRVYRLVTVASTGVKEMVDPTTGEIVRVRTRPKTNRVLAYQEQYLDDTQHYLYDAQVGDLVEGNIVTRSVDPYTIESGDGEAREVTTYSIFTEATTDDPGFEDKVATAFKNAGHTIAPSGILVTKAQQADEEEESEEDTPELVTSEEDDLEDQF